MRSSSHERQVAVDELFDDAFEQVELLEFRLSFLLCVFAFLVAVDLGLEEGGHSLGVLV